MEVFMGPLQTLDEFLANEQRIMEGMTQAERYDALARSTRVAELNSLVDNGVATEAEREELIHRFSTDPQALRMIEAGRAEMKAYIEENGVPEPVLAMNFGPMVDFMLNGDIPTLARLQVETEYLKGAVANNLATDEEIALHRQLERSGPMALIANGPAELLEHLEHPDTAAVEPRDMIPGFEGLASVIDAIMDQYLPMLEGMLGNMNMTRDEFIENLRSEVNGAFTGAVEGGEPPKDGVGKPKPEIGATAELGAGL